VRGGLLALLLLCVNEGSIPAKQLSRDGAKAIARVKQTKVQGLDRAINSRQTLERWLITLSGGRSLPTTWEINDCGEASGTAAYANRDLPMCVEVRTTAGRNKEIVISIVVGTNRTGVMGSPQVAWASCPNTAGSVHFVKTLSELASCVDDHRK
jgi:hypothetical protein